MFKNVDTEHPRYAERRKGVTARLIDSESLTTHIRKIIELTYGQVDGLDKCDVEPLVLVMLKDKDSWGQNRIAIIGTEGVGWKSDKDSRIVSVPVWSNNGMSHARPVELHRDVLVEFATAEVIDLADWVRIFGDRLELNLALWQEQVRPTESVEV